MSDATKNLVSTASASASIVSPLDERYASVMRPLAAHMSEYGLLKYRVAVEIEWLIFMAASDEITHVPPLGTAQPTVAAQQTGALAGIGAPVRSDQRVAAFRRRHGTPGPR